MGLNSKAWLEIFAEQKNFDISRRKIISESLNAQHIAKQGIFALQRDDKKEGEMQIAEATKMLVSLGKRFGKDFHLRMEATWKAAVEEYIEARLFADFYNGRKISNIEEFHVEPDEYIGALSDLTGEIVRMIILWTTRKKYDKVKKASDLISEIIHELMKHNFSGYLRTKFDQAKRNLQKSESILYDLAIREK